MNTYETGKAILQYIIFNDDSVQLLDRCTSSMFEGDATSWLYRKIADHFKTYSAIPSRDILQHMISQEDETLRLQVQDLMLSASPNKKDLAYLLTEADKLRQRTLLEHFVNAAANNVVNGSYERIHHDYLELQRQLSQSDEVLEIRDVDKWSTHNLRTPISTDSDFLDMIMAGGLSPGELGVVVGSSGSGKSFLLCKLGLTAAQAGRNVLHISLELPSGYLFARYASFLMGENPNDVVSTPYKLKQCVSSLPGKVYMINRDKLYVSDIASLARKIPNLDLVIVDYADLLSTAEKQNTYLEMGEVYKDLRTLANELHVPVWTASQSNRGDKDRKVIDDFDVADSYKKIMIADFVLSIFRSQKNKEENVAAFKIIKNRFGYDGKIFRCRCDFANGVLELEPLQEDVKKLKSLNPLSRSTVLDNLANSYSHNGGE